MWTKARSPPPLGVTKPSPLSSFQSEMRPANLIVRTFLASFSPFPIVVTLAPVSLGNRGHERRKPDPVTGRSGDDPLAGRTKLSPPSYTMNLFTTPLK